jgi:hypothetical protein
MPNEVLSKRPARRIAGKISAELGLLSIGFHGAALPNSFSDPPCKERPARIIPAKLDSGISLWMRSLADSNPIKTAKAMKQPLQVSAHVPRSVPWL